MPTFARSQTLIVFALEAEAQNDFNDGATFFCGVGKINATYFLTKALENWRLTHEGNNPDLVLNLGSAGSSCYDLEEIVNPTKFIQRDVDVTAFGAAPYTIISDCTPSLLTNGLRLENQKECTCGSGDSFVTDHAEHEWQVVDMEAHAMAKVCYLEKVPFASLKYITDGANGHAVKSWQEMLPTTAAALRKAINSYLTQ